MSKLKKKLSKTRAERRGSELSELKALLLRRAHSVSQLQAAMDAPEGYVMKALADLQKSGVLVEAHAGLYSVERAPRPSLDIHRSVSGPAGHHRFGLISDTHYGSKYAREEVVDALYDWFAQEGIETVYHAGNWIEGEARFNKHDLLPDGHGMQSQLDYFVRRYPEKRGITTYYVAGDDHEGWYSQREGVDIGRLLENTAKDAGRKDLVNLGYMEAFVTLVNKETQRTSKLLLMHPGGGSAYATSYAPQKIVEAMQPGEKPGLLILGHYHKLEYLNIRGVHTIQAGCTKDLDPFGRKKRLQYHIGGWIIDAWQDAGGAITRVRSDLMQFFDRGYYNGQFNPAGVVRKMRAPHGT